MAWAFVSAAVTLTKTVTKSVTAGNLLVVSFSQGDGTSTPTISDGVNAWTQVSGSPQKDTTNGAAAAMWAAVAATTASITVTITSGAGSFNGTSLAEYSGGPATVQTDGSAGANNIAGSTSTDGQKTGSFTTVANGDLVVSIIVNDGSDRVVAQYTAGTGFTKRATASEDPAGSGQATYAVEDIVQTSAGLINPSWTSNASFPAVGVGAAFKAPSGGGGGFFGSPIMVIKSAWGNL